MPLAILYGCICASLLAAPSPEHFSQYQSVIANLAEPVDAAVDEQGRIFVLEREACRVRVFDVQGRELQGFGERGSDDGELLRPEGLALGERGEAYVADTGNHRVVVFDGAGKLIRSFGGRGRALGKLESPLGLCIAKGVCYVADAGNDRVQTFDLTGAPVREYELDPGRFNRPSDVAVDGSGHLFVCDSRSFRVVKLHADGRWITSFGDTGDPNHLLARPRSLDYQGSRIFVTDSENHRIQAFDTFGQRLFAFGSRSYGVGEGEGRLYAPTSAAVHPEGDFAVVCEPLEDRVQVFRPERESAELAPEVDSGHGLDSHRLDAHRLDIGELPHYGGVGGTAKDLMVLADLELQAVVVFDTSQVDPAPIAKLGSFGPRLGELKEPGCPAVDPLKGRILVSDPGNCRLQVFALQGRKDGDLSFNPLLGELVKAIDFCALVDEGDGVHGGQSPMWPIEPTAICCDSSGNVFLLDARNAAVFLLDAKLRRLRSFGKYGSGEGELRGPTDLALDPAGEVCYVVDADNRRLQVFDVMGNVRGQWGRDGAQALEPFARPRGVGVDPLGRVYVADEASDSVLVFDSAGQPLAEWGGAGSGPAQFRRPSDVLPGALPGGYLYVIDAGNRRGQVLTRDGKFVVVF